MGRIRVFAGFLLLMAVTVAVIGCGGGGGGGEPVVGQTVTAAYYPNAAGDTWAYWGTSSEISGPYFDTVSVTGTKLLLGVNASIFLSDNQGGEGIPIEDYYFKDSRAFTYYGNNDPEDWLSPALIPIANTLEKKTNPSRTPLLDRGQGHATLRQVSFKESEVSARGAHATEELLSWHSHDLRAWGDQRWKI